MKKHQTVTEDVKELQALFIRRKKHIAYTLIGSTVFTFLTFAIIGMRVFYPYHIWIGLGLYIASWLVFIYQIYIGRRTLKRFKVYQFAGSYYQRSKWRIAYGSALFILLLSLLTIFPFNANPYAGLSEQQLEILLAEDAQKAVLLVDAMDILGNRIIKDIEAYDGTTANLELLRKDWDMFLDASARSEQITEVHRYFHRLDGVHRESAFTIAYALYIKKYEMVYRIIEMQKDDTIKKALNHNELGKHNLYTEMTNRLYTPKTLLRLSLGKAYLKSIYSDRETYALLKGVALYSYESFVDAGLITNGPTTISDGFEQQIFSGWFPLQRNVANFMGDTYIAQRHYKLITIQQIHDMQQAMEPGDIMVQRRNWYLSNVGIPGFWAHNALYTGSIEEMSAYFGIDVGAVLEKEYPEIYQAYQVELNDDPVRVIEAREPGVILQSIETSAYADYVGVLRPNISREDKWAALQRAFDHYGKPYDYDFDFDTTDALVCSEVIYAAYEASLTMNLSIINGRKIFSPTDLVRKYHDEYGSKSAELSFIYFIDASEREQHAFVSDETAFRESWNRNKFSWFNN